VLDLERIEVLQGPQGTLFGAGAMAGTVRQITKKPEFNDFYGSVEAVGSQTSKFGGFNHNVRGTVNVPVKDNVLALRLTGYTGNDSGYVRNEVNGKTDNDVSTNQGRVAAPACYAGPAGRRQHHRLQRQGRHQRRLLQTGAVHHQLADPADQQGQSAAV
jgi:outer membrane receptor protein involved in Fe transport